MSYFRLVTKGVIMSQTTKTVFRVISVIFIVLSLASLYLYQDIEAGTYRFIARHSFWALIPVAVILLALSFFLRTKQSENESV